MSSRAPRFLLLGALAAAGLPGCASNRGRGVTPTGAPASEPQALAAPSSGPHAGAVPSPPAELLAPRVVQRAYVALVRTSIVPADPRAIGTAALKAGASRPETPASALPDGWGGDPERDGASVFC